MTATASYSAVPFMLTVAPTGNTNLDMFLLILFLSSVHLSDVGSAAVLDAVANAINNASSTFLVYVNTFWRVITQNTKGKNMQPVIHQ